MRDEFLSETAAKNAPRKAIKSEKSTCCSSEKLKISFRVLLGDPREFDIIFREQKSMIFHEKSDKIDQICTEKCRAVVQSLHEAQSQCIRSFLGAIMKKVKIPSQKCFSISADIPAQIHHSPLIPPTMTYRGA